MRITIYLKFLLGYDCKISVVLNLKTGNSSNNFNHF